MIKLKDRVAVISEANMNGLRKLYGELTIDELYRIINNHIQVAIEEIEDDCNKLRLTGQNEKEGMYI